MTTPRTKRNPAATAAAALLGSNIGDAPDVPAEFLPQAAKQAAVAAAAAPAVERVWIMLEENDEISPGGQFIGLNGRGYLLQPGVAAHVPKGLLGVLDNAVKSVPRIDMHTRQVVGWKDQLRLPYRILTDQRTV